MCIKKKYINFQTFQHSRDIEPTTDDYKIQSFSTQIKLSNQTNIINPPFRSASVKPI